MSFAPALVLREGDRKKLDDLARLPSVPSELAKRARIILLAADGTPERGDRPAGRGVAADGDRVAGALRGRRNRGAGGCRPVRPARGDRRDRGQRGRRAR
jgi:hypothetical protein